MAKTSILVVEDEYIVGKDIEARLASLQYDVIAVVGSGEEALAMVRGRMPDLVLMDIMLKGGMDGIAAAREIRSFADVPIVFLTAFADMQTLRRAQVTDAFGYLLKPFEERELQITIEMALYKHRMESRLRESEQRYRNFFEEALTGNYSALADGTIVDCNEAFTSILRFPSKADAKGANLHALYPDPRSLAQFLEHLAVNRRLTYYEKELRSVDGRRVHVIENAIAEVDAEGKLLGYKGYMFDDTVRKRLEEQLQQSHKMESVGTMASGIAHDFNNIINNVLGFATQLTKHVHDPVKVLKYAETIEKSATRGAELSAQLLTFARVGQRENRPLNVRQVVDEVVALCTETFPRSIVISKRVEPDVRMVLGDHGGLYQVLLNLCVNARDAIVAKDDLGNGLIAVEARNTVAGSEVSAQLIGGEGTPCVELRVSDDGSGIPREIRDKIFDPFFTTKERGRGTGLGLAVVYSIVRNHHGVLLVESDEGRGSTFRVILPSLDQLVDVQQTTDILTAAHGKNELILVVDDEESMQDLARDLLEDAGYRVLTAGSGFEAIDVFRQKSDEIDLVVLDLLMSGLDGGQTYLALKRIRPDVKVFFCTGFMPDEVISSLLERDHLLTIQKPFQPSVFVKAVRDTIDRQTLTGAQGS
jgi:two-component system cell cycle sensor histidine kinase/response regulator CckA